MIAVRRYPEGPRVWVANQRAHHGATGCALLPLLLRKRTRVLGVVGVALVLHDRHDWRVWFVREKLPAVTLDRS